MTDIFTSLPLGVFQTQTGFKLTAILLHHPLAPPFPGNTEFSSSPRQKHEWVTFVFLTSAIPSILPLLLPLVWIQVLVWGWGWGHRAPLSLPWLLSLPWPAACVLEFHHLCTISKVSFSQRFVYLSFAH